MAGTLTFNVDAKALVALSSMLTAAQATTIKTFRKTINDAGGQLIGGRAAELSSWSKQIPRTIRWNTTGSLSRITLMITAGYKSVPIAKWYELGHSNESTSWWHPVWPRQRKSPLQDQIARKKWKWVPQAKGDYHRPYLYPALQEKRPAVNQVTLNALITALLESVPYFKLDSVA